MGALLSIFVAPVVAIIIISGVSSLVGSVVLSALGFSAAGPVAGSVAASWMAATGLVAKGSFYAVLQSAAMGGSIGILPFIGAAVTFTVATCIAGIGRAWQLAIGRA